MGLIIAILCIPFMVALYKLQTYSMLYDPTCTIHCYRRGEPPTGWKHHKYLGIGNAQFWAPPWWEYLVLGLLAVSAVSAIILPALLCWLPPMPVSQDLCNERWQLTPRARVPHEVLHIQPMPSRRSGQVRPDGSASKVSSSMYSQDIDENVTHPKPSQSCKHVSTITESESDQIIDIYADLPEEDTFEMSDLSSARHLITHDSMQGDGTGALQLPASRPATPSPVRRRRQDHPTQGDEHRNDKWDTVYFAESDLSARHHQV